MPHYKTKEEVNAEFDEKFPALMPRDSRIKLKSFIHTLRTDDLQAVRERVRELKKEYCLLGGFGHSHNPWICGDNEKLCEYCDHIEQGKCINPLSTEQTEIYNTAVDEALSSLEHNIQ